MDEEDKKCFDGVLFDGDKSFDIKDVVYEAPEDRAGVYESDFWEDFIFCCSYVSFE